MVLKERGGQGRVSKASINDRMLQWKVKEEFSKQIKHSALGTFQGLWLSDSRCGKAMTDL